MSVKGFLLVLSLYCALVECFIVTVSDREALKHHIKFLKNTFPGMIPFQIASTFYAYSFQADQMPLWLHDLPGILSIEENIMIKISSIAKQDHAPWYLSRLSSRSTIIQQNAIFEYPENAGTNVTVYIVDTGVDPFHEEFINGFNQNQSCFNTRVQLLYPPDADVGRGFDDHGHGTMTASLAAGKTFGVAKNATIVSVKALNAQGEADLQEILRAIEWIAARTSIGNEGFGKSVVNLSFGARRSNALNRAVEALTRQGVVVVAAAGNEGDDACDVSPASQGSVITVGSVNKRNDVSTFSNTGRCVDVFAPGEDINAAWISQSSSPCDKSISSTRNERGTSFAAPLVAGVVATYLFDDNMRDQKIFSRASGSKYVSSVRRYVTEQATNGLIELSWFSRSPNKIAYSWPYGQGQGQ
ncbi:hypothetical protein MP638_005995 [Amoeboaphelidium occidentale]|nr:hypothetical protein MP638_005995 [Amoeboaphelidium occidentale]